MIVPHAQIRAEVEALYKSGGLPRGSVTGWPSVDLLYTVAMGQWTLIGGWPGSGKSEWLDALMVNLAKREEWKFIIFSPENWPLALHHSKILEKYLGRPFNPGPTQRMNEEELDAGEEWMAGKFCFAKPDNPTLESILDEAIKRFQYPALIQSVRPHKVGVVIDPWNQLEHYRPSGMTETEYISLSLSEVIRVCRDAQFHVWIVAHPTKMMRGKDGKLPIPTPHDVSGGANWWNKADNAITIWRDQGENSAEVEIHVQKIRFRHIGRVGLATLRYNRVTGQYSEILKPISDTQYRMDIDG